MVNTNHLKRYGVLGMKSGKRKGEPNKMSDTKSQSNARLDEKLLYSNATRELATNYVRKNNMTVSEAYIKVKQDTMRYTANAVAVVGGYAYNKIKYIKA